MAEHNNLSKYTGGKEELLQQGIHDYLMADSACFFKSPKCNLKAIINNLFDNLNYANGPDFAGDTEFQGDTVKGGMVYNFIQAFKTLFVDSRNKLGKIDLDTIQKANLLEAYDMLHSGMESYGVLIARRNYYIKNKKTDSERYTLGAYVNDITNRLMDRCRFEEEDTMATLKGLLRSALVWRNDKDHNNADKSYLWTHIKGMILFMCASEYCSYLIRGARFGGVRYETHVPGKIVFYTKEKEVTFMSNASAKSGPQFTPVYQFNLPAKWSEDMNCRVDFYSLDGKLLDSRPYSVMGNNFCTFKYEPKKETAVTESDSKKEEQSKTSPKPRLKSTINFDLIKGKPFMEGSYIGKVDENEQPNGKGTYSAKGAKYEGAFVHGKPDGTFTIRYEETNDPFIFVGELNEDFSPCKGSMNYPKDNKIYEGEFKGWGLVQGKKIKSGKLVYEGEFEVIIDSEGLIYNLYNGMGRLYTEEGVYEGEFSYGEISGKGKMTYTDGRPPVYGVWSQGIIVKEEPLPDDEMQTEPAQDAPMSNAGSEVQQEDNNAGPTPDFVLVVLNLPDEPVCIKDAEGNLMALSDEDTSIKLPPCTKLSATLLSDERAITYYQSPEEPGFLVQWDIAGELGKIVAELPSVVGSGTIVLDNGTYKGEWNKDKRPHGKGTLTLNDGQVYTGEFKDGKYDGQGELRMLRQTYTGGFKNGVYHGCGTTRLKNGDMLEGNYENGLKEGEFTLTTVRGLVRKSYWEKGELIS